MGNQTNRQTWRSLRQSRPALQLLRALKDHTPPAPAGNAHHLRVGAGADDHGGPSLRLCLLNQAVNPLDKGAGGIHHLDRQSSQGLLHLPGYAVGTEHHRTPRPDLLRAVCHLHPHALEPVHHMMVMNDGPQGHHRAPSLCGFLHHVHRPVHAKAEACVLSKLYIHRAIRSSTMAFSAARDSSWLRLDVSSTTASFACLSGAMDLVISWWSRCRISSRTCS
ncbi:unknown [Firmicutes bacterium CAG:137]|nr:unknown [Firmicutes bacterium CAG:137]